MTKDELIALISDDTDPVYARDYLWPQLVEFVESWLREQGKQAFFDPETFWLANVWCEEMGA